MMARVAIAVSALAAVACGQHDAPSVAAIPNTVAGIAPIGMNADDALLLNLARLAIGGPPPPALVESTRGQPIEAYIDALLASDAFADYVGRSVVLGPLLTTQDEAQLNLIKLHTFQADVSGQQTNVYQLLEPCDAKDAVSVRPWWDADHPIKICPSAYAPTHLVDPETGFHCGSKNQVDQLRNLAAQRTADGKPITTGTYCGCGPSLAFCVPDDDTRAMMRKSLENEVTDTVTQVLREDHPLEDAFTHNETFRDSRADFYYQRARLLAGEIKALPPVDKEAASWRRRPESWPGQQAGIFTAYHLLHMNDGTRPRLRDFFSIAWCKDEGSHGATAEKVFALGATDLRSGGGWQKLAAMPMCTNCHARLDYGMQFFLGYSSAFDGFFESSKLVAHGSGPIYGDDISDLRGNAELTPAGFARFVVGQPEFAHCLAQRVTRHVLGDSASPDDIDALDKVFEQTRRVKPVMREALLRFALSWNAPHSPLAIAGGTAPLAQAGSASAGSASAQIVVPAPLRRMLDANCIECHDKAKAPERDFTVARLDRSLVANMLHHVAWGDMPRSHGIMKSEREEMVRQLIVELWPAGPERAIAEHYYLGLQGLPIHNADAIRTAMGGAPPDLALEPLVDSSRVQYSPGFVSSIAKSAVTICGDRKGAEFDTCIHDHVAPVLFVNRRLPWLTTQ